jgi:hypothetical protein
MEGTIFLTGPMERTIIFIGPTERTILMIASQDVVDVQGLGHTKLNAGCRVRNVDVYKEIEMFIKRSKIPV